MTDTIAKDQRPLPCGCVPHKTRMSPWGTALYCETEGQPYCNFECPHADEALHEWRVSDLNTLEKLGLDGSLRGIKNGGK